MQVWITSFTGISIIEANSFTETNSVTLSTFFSSSCLAASSFCFSLIACRFSLLYLAPFDLPLVVSLERVSLICFCTSSSFTSLRTGRFFFAFFFFGWDFLSWALSCCCFLLSTCTFSLSLWIRFLRFLFGFLSSDCLSSSFFAFSFSLRSSSFSFRVLRSGRVFWFKESRSILPTTFICSFSSSSLISTVFVCPTETFSGVSSVVSSDLGVVSSFGSSCLVPFGSFASFASFASFCSFLSSFFASFSFETGVSSAFFSSVCFSFIPLSEDEGCSSFFVFCSVSSCFFASSLGFFFSLVAFGFLETESRSIFPTTLGSFSSFFFVSSFSFSASVSSCSFSGETSFSVCFVDSSFFSSFPLTSLMKISSSSPVSSASASSWSSCSMSLMEMLCRFSWDFSRLIFFDCFFTSISELYSSTNKLYCSGVTLAFGF